MNHTLYALRRDNVRAQLRDKGLSALLVSNAANRYYLSGFELHDPQPGESAGILVIFADGQDWLCTDPRYLDAANSLWDSRKVFIYRGDGTAQTGEWLHSMVQGPVGFEPKSLSVYQYEALRDNLDLVAAPPLTENLRAIKNTDEIQRLRKSCRLNHQLMEWLPLALVAGISEKTLAWNIEKFFRERGASELAFATIVAYGKNAALPHAIPGDTALEENSLVLVDAGARLEGYCSDQTRTFWLGSRPSKRFMDTLAAVREAQACGLSLIRPGVEAREVYQGANDHFARLGLASQFTHSLGHGIGLETHEGLSLGPKSTTRLEEGMVLTVEPGLYDAAWGGIRWEYMVLVTKDGHELL